MWGTTAVWRPFAVGWSPPPPRVRCPGGRRRTGAAAVHERRRERVSGVLTMGAAPIGEWDSRPQFLHAPRTANLRTHEPKRSRTGRPVLSPSADAATVSTFVPGVSQWCGASRVRRRFRPFSVSVYRCAKVRRAVVDVRSGGVRVSFRLRSVALCRCRRRRCQTDR